MSQHDMNIADADGATVRSDLNSALAALVSQSSGASAPSTSFAYMRWADTTNGVVKRRNAANSAWLIDGTLAETFAVSRSSNTILGVSDNGKNFVATSSFTQTLTAAATLGDGWFVCYRVNSGVTITFDPNSTETIDGAATKAVVGPCSGIIICTGSAFLTYGFDSPAASETVSGVLELATQAEVNAMADTARALTPNHNKLVLGTEAATTSGTSHSFTGIPAGVRRITINFQGVSTAGPSNLLVQLGTSSGLTTSGYVSSAAAVNNAAATNVASATNGFIVTGAWSAAGAASGSIVLTLVDATNNEWVASGVVKTATSAVNVCAGNVALAGVADRVAVLSVSGDTFDAGSVNIIMER